jgi:hypothetical protein
MYSEDPIVNDIVLTIINDGNGEMCGMTYADRQAAARRDGCGRYQFEAAARRYVRYWNRNFRDDDERPRKISRAQQLQVGEILVDYYRAEGQ